MVIGLSLASLSIPAAQSLKDKRMVLRSLKDRIRNTMNVSVAEVAKQDVWKLAELAFITVAAEKEVVEKRLSEISTVLHGNPRIVLLDISTQLM